MLVLLQVSHDVAREAMLRSIASLGHEAIPVKLPVLTPSDDDPAVLVYDLDPWNLVAVSHLRGVRTRYPALPVLLYPPQFLHKQVAALLLQCQDVGGLTIAFQDTRETQDLALAIKVALDSTPSLILETLMRLLLAGPRFTTGRSYVLQILTKLSRRTTCWRSPGVATISAEIDIHLRKLEREHLKTGLADPSTVLHYVLLLWVLGIGAFARLPFAKAVRASGLDRKRIERLRASLLGALDAKAPADQLFDIAFLKFAEACGLPRQRAEETLRARAG